MWEKGLFSAGEYSLTINMDGTVNYGSLEKSFVFTVYKKTLTVTADDKSVVYGGAAPEYSYSVSGFVAGKTDGVVDTEADILGTENNFFTS
ncbi:MAG: MBG domain-containing protein, partial [Clostridia bacterium]|nr:MBG domain-containing protein [Clostridia bacterium]